MNSQDRIIKKMIDNIVENNKPAFERPVSHSSEGTVAVAQESAPALKTEDYNLISRKLEYGFNTLRQENADLRKQIEELAGIVKMLRNDMDQLRMTVQRSGAHAPRHEEPVNAPPTAMNPAHGAPQYRKTAADEAYEARNGAGAVPDHDTPVAPQARGFAPKSDPAKDAGVDISKVFYYGKK